MLCCNNGRSPPLLLRHECGRSTPREAMDRLSIRRSLDRRATHPPARPGFAVPGPRALGRRV